MKKKTAKKPSIKNTKKTAALTVKALKQVSGGSKFYGDRTYTAGSTDTLQ